MADDESTSDGFTGALPRRSFVKTGALASGALALGLAGAGGATAQDGETAFGGLMFANDFFPGSTFEVVSASIDWAPVETDEEGDDFLGEADDNLLFDNPEIFAEYDTRVIQYDYATASYSLLFPRQDVGVQEGQRYQLSPAIGVFGAGEAGVEDDLLFEEGNELGLIRVQFDQVQDGGDGGAGNQTDAAAGNETAGNETADD